MAKIPPKGRKGTTSSTRRIADRLGIPMGKGRPVKPATAGPVPPPMFPTPPERKEG